MSSRITPGPGPRVVGKRRMAERIYNLLSQEERKEILTRETFLKRNIVKKDRRSHLN